MSATPLALQSFYNQNKFSTPNSSLHCDSGKSPTGAPYLPGFLLGNSPAAPVYGRSLSTAPYQSNSPSKINSKSPPNRSASFPYTSPIERKQRISPTNSSRQDIGSAPPTESLYSNFPSSSLSDIDALKRTSNNESILGSSQTSFNNSVFSPQPEVMPQSPAQIDPFYSQGESISSTDVLDDTAVTVFGFPPAASSFILQQFAQYGTIDKHEIHNAGNWLHLKYQTKIQAKKALSKNGKIFARSIMIGVCPCIKKEIASMEAELNTSGLSSVGTPQINARKSTTMRPLSTSASLMRNASSASEPPASDKRTPQKNDSVVGKALDYVFGW